MAAIAARRIPRSTVNAPGATGRIPPGKTNLALQKTTPFHGKKMVSFEYLNELTPFAPGAVLGNISVCANDIFDFDRSGTTLGNKQPLYYDTFLTASGPYKSFKVISWETTYTIINTGTSPVTIWAIPPVGAAAEIDSAAEADNFPGMQVLYLTGSAGTKTFGTITVKGHINDVYPNYKEANSTLSGGFGTSPTSQVFQGLVVHSSDNTTNVTVTVAVRHVPYVELSSVDALVS